MRVGRMRVGLSTGDDGSASIGLRDAKNKARVGLGIGKDGTAALGFRDPEGRPSMVLISQPDAIAGLSCCCRTKSARRHP